MTTLIIIAALVAIAYIFGKDAAKLIIVGSGTLAILGIILIILGTVVIYFWDAIQNNQAAQKMLGYFAIILVFTVFSIIKERHDQQKSEKEEEVELMFVPKHENKKLALMMRPEAGETKEEFSKRTLEQLSKKGILRQDNAEGEE